MISCALITVLAVTCVALLKLLSVLSMGWCKSNTCLVGKTVIITGGNSGLGYQTALALAGRGARIIIADVVDTKEAVKTLIDQSQNNNVVGKHLDLASLDSVRKFCDDIHREENRLDILINNAGVGCMPLQYTKDGLQIHMQVNYFGHFLLTHLLIDLLKKNRSRIIFVSSIAAFINNLTIENLNTPPSCTFESLTHWANYNNTKLCALIASNIFADKLKNTSVTCNAVYPGFVATPFFRNACSSINMSIVGVFFYLLAKFFGKSAYEGAQTQINCALSKDLENVSGKYFGDCKQLHQPKLAKDKDFCKRFWEKSEELVKLKMDEKLI